MLLDTDEKEMVTASFAVREKFIDARIGKIVRLSSAPEQARSLPAVASPTSPDVPVRGSKSKEHPQPISSTSGDDLPFSDFECDPTLQR